MYFNKFVETKVPHGRTAGGKIYISRIFQEWGTWFKYQICRILLTKIGKIVIPSRLPIHCVITSTNVVHLIWYFSSKQIKSFRLKFFDKGNSRIIEQRLAFQKLIQFEEVPKISYQFKQIFFWLHNSIFWTNSEFSLNLSTCISTNL